MSLSRSLILSCSLLAACATTQGGKPPPAPTPEPEPEVNREVREPSEEELEQARKRSGWGVIRLDGTPTIVRWSDGDSFKFKSGVYEGSGVRLTDYNTLESYGPVHRWGKWTALELYDIAKSSRFVASKGEWECSTEGDRDGYGRVLVSCPGAAEAMLEAGHAHVFAIDSPASKRLLAVQQRAQAEGKGIWAKGVPPMIVTSLHSADEQGAGEGEQAGTYDRMVDTKSGASSKHLHDDVYAVCQEVCHGPEDDPACMVYVPFERRYRDKADCIRTGRDAGEESPD